MKTNEYQFMQQKLAILLTLPSLGGLELNLLKFCKYRVQKLGFETLLILAKGSSAEKWAIKEKLPYQLLSKPRKYFSFKQILELKKIMLKSKCHKVFISTSQDLDLSSWLKKFSHELNDIKIIFYQQMQLGLVKKNFYHRWKFSKVDYWIAPLPWLKNELLAKTTIPETKITILPLCLDTESFLNDCHSTSKFELMKKYHIPENAIIFGIVGRIDPGKGQLSVIENFHQLLLMKPKSQEVKLCLIGSVTQQDNNAKLYEEKIQQAIITYQLEKYIIRIPHIHNPAAIYKLLDVLIVASQKETFGMVTVEGLLAQLVVIGAQSGGTADLLGHGEFGLLYNPSQTHDLAKKMQYTMENFESLKQKNSKNNFANEFDFHRLEQFLKKVN